MGKKNRNFTSTHSAGSNVNAGQKSDTLQSVYADNQTFQKPFPKPSLIPLALIAMLIGFLSGLVSIILFLSGSLRGIPYLGAIDIGSLFPNAPITIERTEKVTVLANEQSSEVIKKSQSILYGIFAAEDLTLDVAGLIRSTLPPRATAIAVTSDGWLLTGMELAEDVKKYVVANRDGELFPISAISKDEVAKLTYIRVQAQGLSVATFPRNSTMDFATSEVIVPQFHIGLSSLPASMTTAILETPAIRSSDAYVSRIMLSQTLPEGALGAPVMLLGGEVVGVVINRSMDAKYAIAVPAWHFGSLLDQLAKTGDIIRPSLGVQYLELSSGARLKFSLLQDRRAGALLIDSENQEAVLKDSNASLSGLKAGDIITKVDGEMVNDITDLTRLIQSYKPDAKVNITWVRNGEEKTSEVSLSPVQEKKANAEPAAAKSPTPAKKR